MARKPLNGWWRLWIVSVPLWWAFCLWRHLATIDDECGFNYTTIGLCFREALWWWIYAAFVGPIALGLVMFLGRWVRRGFSESKESS